MIVSTAVSPPNKRIICPKGNKRDKNFTLWTTWQLFLLFWSTYASDFDCFSNNSSLLASRGRMGPDFRSWLRIHYILIKWCNTIHCSNFFKGIQKKQLKLLMQPEWLNGTRHWLVPLKTTIPIMISCRGDQIHLWKWVCTLHITVLRPMES